MTSKLYYTDSLHALSSHSNWYYTSLRPFHPSHLISLPPTPAPASTPTPPISHPPTTTRPRIPSSLPPATTTSPPFYPPRQLHAPPPSPTARHPDPHTQQAIHHRTDMHMAPQSVGRCVRRREGGGSVPAGREAERKRIANDEAVRRESKIGGDGVGCCGDDLACSFAFF